MPLSFGKTSTGKWTPQGAFQQIVGPALMAGGLLPRGDLVNAEGTNQDLRAGIDWIISEPDGTQSTVAARVQWDRDYGTFSIRYRTEKGQRSELTKRYQSVMNGASYPTYTVQAYVTQPDGRLLNAYVIRTEDLYRHVIVMDPVGDPDRFTLSACAVAPKWAPGGAEFVPVAITEDGKAAIGSRSTLHGCGVPVQSLRAINEGPGLWGGERCYTCGLPPDRRFPDGSPGYSHSHAKPDRPAV